MRLKIKVSQDYLEKKIFARILRVSIYFWGNDTKLLLVFSSFLSNSICIS